MNTITEEESLYLDYVNLDQGFKEIERARLVLLKKGCSEESLTFKLGVEPGYYDDPGEGIIWLRGTRPKTEKELAAEKKAAEWSKLSEIERLKKRLKELGITINE